MTLNEKFEQRIKQVDRAGRNVYGTSYVSFWRFMYFIRRVEIVGIDHERLANIQSLMGEKPELAINN